MERIWGRVAAIAIAGYFLYFAIPALGARWAPDDMMNLGLYWQRGFPAYLWDVARFWSTAYRPMGAMFYMPLYHFFNLNPLPYRVAMVGMLAANLFLSYRVAEMLTRSKAVAALTAMLVCAHGSMVPIYYNTSMLYDVMAYFFLMGMMFVYVRVRGEGRGLTIGEGALVVCAFIAALDSKEIAVTGAGWVLAYEVLFEKRWKLIVPGLLVVIAAVDAAGKFLGPHALARQDGYLLELTAHRFFINNRLYVNELFYGEYFKTSRMLVIAWVLVAALCWVAKKRELWWSWFVVSTAMLPVAFTVQPRSGGSLYVPLFGFALLMSIAVAGFWKQQAPAWGAAAVVALLCGYETVHLWRERVPIYMDQHRLTWSVIEQLRALPSRPGHGERVLFLSNPFADYDVWFISMLLWNDRTVDVTLANKLATAPSAQEMQRFDRILTFDAERLRVIRAR